MVKTDTTLVQHGVVALKWLVDGLKEQLKRLAVALVSVAENVSGFALVVRQRWDVRWYVAFASIASALFHLPVRRSRQCLASLGLGFSSSGALYFAHLYYGNTWATLMFGLIAILALCPLSSPFRAVGLLTIVHLLLPIIGTILKTILAVQLVLGPVLGTVINCGSILIHIVCLMGLYVDEKLLLVKVFLLPVYQTFLGLFEHNDAHASLLDSIAQSVDALLSGIGAQDGHHPGQLDSILRQLCENATTAWYTACPALFAQSCATLIDSTDLAKADKGLEVAGKWLTDLLLAGRKMSPVQRTAAKQLCKQMADGACRAIDIAGYCTPDKTFYDAAYTSFTAALDKLKNSVMTSSSWIKMIPVQLDGSQSVFQMGVEDLVRMAYHAFSLTLAVFALCLILRALILAVCFLRRYRRDPLFAERSTPAADGLWDRVKWGPLAKVSVLFFIERSVRWLHDTLQDVQFVVPEYGDARFAFNVQGNGTVGRLLSSVLSGGFNLQSKYCKVANSSVCSTFFFPVTWQVCLCPFHFRNSI